MSLFQDNLHVAAYFETIMSILDTPDAKETAKLVLKQVGLVTGAVVLGTLVLGPFGLVAGAGIGGAGAITMTPHGSEYEDMLGMLRNMSYDHKRLLVSEVEELVEENGCEDLTKFARKKINRKKLLNTVTFYLVESFDYKVPGKAKKTTKSRTRDATCSDELQDLLNMSDEEQD